ncbi:MAG: 2-oxo acid dehydrogenase subunit E2, partial [Steroidobacteraceae bacterium]
MAQDITVPDLGDFKDVEVIDVLVKAGDKIEVDTPLITLETEKAAMDVPATAAGVVKAVAVKKGDHVSKGSVIVQVEAVSAEEKAPASAPTPPKAAPAEPAKPKQPEQQAAAASPAPSAPTASRQPPTASADFSSVHASPSIRKFARELGVDLTAVKGSGPKGRVTADDVKAWVKQALKAGPAAGGGALPKVPEVDFAKFGAIEVKPLGRIQKISGPRLQASWVNVPHVWQMDEADITELEETRNRLKAETSKAGVKLTPLAFILRACVQALREFPMVNSSLDGSGQNLVLKKYVHLGFAADTPNGLV